MKICYLADGQSIHTKRWCNYFAQRGYEVHLITFREAKIENTAVHFINTGNVSVKGGNWKVLLKIGGIKKILLEIKPDILHAHYATSYGIAGALTGFHPYIITALGSDILISPQKSFLYKILVKYALKKADWITAMADHMKDVIIGFGINPKNVKTIIFGIDPQIFNHNHRKVSEENFVIISTRNFEPIYNIELLLKALYLIKDKIPGLFVNLIGEGSLRSSLEKTVETFGLTNKVKFHGKIPQTEISKTLNGSHLFVTSSLSDGNNVSLNEAMACGTISLATDIPANREWIKSGVNGFLVPIDQPEILADKILYVYKNYKRMEEKAIPFNDRLISAKALWSANMAIVDKKYKELVKNKMKHNLIIIGTGGHGKVVAEAAMHSFNIIGFVDDNVPVGTEILKGIKVIASGNEIKKLKSSATHFIAAIGTNETRKNVFHSFSEHLKDHVIMNASSRDSLSVVDHDKSNIHVFING